MWIQEIELRSSCLRTGVFNLGHLTAPSFLFLIMRLCVFVCGYMHKVQCPWKPEEDLRPPETRGGPRYCEPVDVSARNKTQVSFPLHEQYMLLTAP